MKEKAKLESEIAFEDAVPDGTMVSKIQCPYEMISTLTEEITEKRNKTLKDICEKIESAEKEKAALEKETNEIRSGEKIVSPERISEIFERLPALEIQISSSKSIRNLYLSDKKSFLLDADQCDEIIRKANEFLKQESEEWYNEVLTCLLRIIAVSQKFEKTWDEGSQTVNRFVNYVARGYSDNYFVIDDFGGVKYNLRDVLGESIPDFRRIRKSAEEIGVYINVPEDIILLTPMERLRDSMRESWGK